MQTSHEHVEADVSFRHERIDARPPCGNLGICLPTDLTGNGLPDVIVGGMGREASLGLPGRTIKLDNIPVFKKLYRRMEPHLFWYENPGWKRHVIAPQGDLYIFGNALGDINGDGRVDLVAGQGLGGTDIYWFEQPANPREKWPMHLVSDRFEKYHDLAVGDIDDDGELELVGCSQVSETVFYYDIPDDPSQEPWPDSHLHVVCEDINVEGLEIVDIDGDGRTELIAGPNVFSRGDDGWEREEFAPGWEWTRIAVADLDDDGDLEIVLAEGDRPYNGEIPGRVAVFDQPGWTPTVLNDDLSNPHTVQIADFDGDGRPDIYVAEMGLQTDSPRQFVYRNLGSGEFAEVLVGQGVATHEAKAVDLTGNGRPDIVGKSYFPSKHVDIWYNETGV